MRDELVEWEQAALYKYWQQADESYSRQELAILFTDGRGEALSQHESKGMRRSKRRPSAEQHMLAIESTFAADAATCTSL